MVARCFPGGGVAAARWFSVSLVVAARFPGASKVTVRWVLGTKVEARWLPSGEVAGGVATNRSGILLQLFVSQKWFIISFPARTI